MVTARHLSIEDGLASRMVLCGTKDKQGFIWFGTNDGLNRYDGESFLTFRSQQNNLRGNKILQLACDDSDNLFINIGNTESIYERSGKIDVMNLGTYAIKTLSQQFLQLPFKESNVVYVTNDGNGNVILITVNPEQIWRYSSKSRFNLITGITGWSGRVPGYIWNSVQEGYSFLSIAGIYRNFYFCGDSVSFSSQKMMDTTLLVPYKAIGNNSFGFYTTAKDSSIHYGLIASGGKKCPPDNESVFHSDGNIHDCLQYTFPFADSLLLIKQKQGYYLFGPHINLQLVTTEDFKSYIEMTPYQEFKGNMISNWLCTSNGVFQFQIEPHQFLNYFTRSELNNGDINQVRGISCDDSGTVYANLWNKLYIQKGGVIKSFYSRNILYALEQEEDKVYLGNLSCFDKKKSTIQKFHSAGDTSSIWSIFPVSPDTLLLGRADGIVKFEVKNTTISKVGTKAPEAPMPHLVYGLRKIKNGQIYAAAENGLFILDKNGTILDYYGNSKVPGHTFPFDKLCDVYEDKTGIIWLATNGYGLYRWNKARDEFRQFTETDGLPSEVLYRIEPDGYGDLWISSDRGLIRFNATNCNIHIYTTLDGLPDNEFNRSSSFRATDGRLFFGGLNGVVAFYPKDLLSDTVANNAPMRVISYSKFSGSQNKLINYTGNSLSEKTITLEPGDRFFDIEFRLLDYLPGKKLYKYKIDGFDRDWNIINENSLRISGLPYGNYILHIKGQSPSGAWSASEITIPVEVIAPFYRSISFIIFVIVLLILSIYVLIKWRTRTIKNENIKLEKTISERTSELKKSMEAQAVLLKEIHHRVKNNLQVVSGLLELQSDRITDEKAKDAITDGQNRVRSIALIHQKLYQGDNFAAFELNEFVKELYRQIAGVYLKPGQTVDTDFNIGETHLDIDTAVPLGLILNELFTNSFKYGFTKVRGKLTVTLSKDTANEYHLIYYDNGPGLPAGLNLSHAKTLGLKLIYGLSQQLDGTTEYRYENGSVFTIRFIDNTHRET